MTGNPSVSSQVEEWNDSLKGEFLWSSVNTREGIPDVMTPSTWALWRVYYVEANPVRLPDQYPFAGNICGRPYLNLSLVVSMYRAVGKDIRKEMHGDIIGSIPPDLDIPIIPFSPLNVVRLVLPGMIKARRYASQSGYDPAKFVAATPPWCRKVLLQIEQSHERNIIELLWNETIYPYFSHCCNLLRSVTMKFTDQSNRLRLDLVRLIGEASAFALMSHVNTHPAGLESLMPVLGLPQVLRGDMSREQYIERYGHRGPHELELSAPGPEEDSGWVDRLLADSTQNMFNAEERVAKQKAEWENAWQQFQNSHPRQASSVLHRLGSIAVAARQREAVRSELTRLTRLVRQFLLRVGKVTGLEEEIFFLSLTEMANLLTGDRSSIEKIPARQELYAKYASLPPYPSIIIGKFDPFQWASDHDRRSDLFDSRATQIAPGDRIKGFPGAAGCVEGLVRRIDRMEDGYQVCNGEILVTITTNVGWTPLFPRLAAVVTDVGAPLSHAAIVAREMGIPAVVGCGNATMRLKTGDRIRVNGSTGVVEVIEGWK
jgi:phosphohistidine swiveling domain-containing protein